MRNVMVGMGAGLLALLCAAPLSAQTATEGPLAAPGTTAPAVAAPAAKPAKTATKSAMARPKHRKPAKAAQHATPATQDYGTAALPSVAHPIATGPAATTSDPVDFGMKWNGSGDTARETRVQNYDGNAQGTGAEVGMKLHF